MAHILDLERLASGLILKIRNSCDHKYGLSSMSCSIYDTAWLAMIRRQVNGQHHWLFEESFEFILDHQQDDGGWQAYPSQIDGILNTLAALLAICKRSPQTAKHGSAELEERKSRAISFLNNAFSEWDIKETLHIGFEVLVPALLEQLESEGVNFIVKEKDTLLHMRDQKLRNFRPELLYGNTPITALYSLEAFIGKLDFNRISHHKVFGSMMASPSSTAAYLINCSSWDEESEKYLQHMVVRGEGNGSGAVAGTFPTTVFEISWTLSTFLESGFTPDSLGNEGCEVLSDKLAAVLESQSGLVGFAPEVLPDADDTGKAIITLNLLGKSVSVKHMAHTYESGDHFQTFVHESSPSFSANCNVLRALLSSLDVNQYATQVEKALKFICAQWWDSNRQIRDKWNLSPNYSVMLMAQTLVQTIVVWDKGRLPSLDILILQDRVSTTLLQVLIHTLQTQNEDGSWGKGQRCETSAYAVLALAATQDLPFVSSMRWRIHEALEGGREYISKAYQMSDQADRTWIGKTTYSLNNLCRCYVLASLRVSPPAHIFTEKVEQLAQIPALKVRKFEGFYSQLPLLDQCPSWKIHASLLEAYLFLPQLKRIQSNIFPRKDMAEDKYFEYIPFTWIANVNLQGACVPAKALHEMMIISFLGYQADEYMETVIDKNFGDRLDEIQDVISLILEEFAVEEAGLHSPTQPDRLQGRGPRSGHSTNDGFNANTKVMSKLDILEVHKTLHDLVKFIMHHPTVSSASLYDQRQVHAQTKKWLLAHMGQIEDNKAFSLQENSLSANATFKRPKGSYFDWVRTAGADFSAVVHSFTFYTCLFSKKGEDFFPTAKEKYYAQAFISHLATTCRIYNDIGSLARDRAEKNLNSVNFPEFAGDSANGSKSNKALTDELMELADHERACVDLWLGKLKSESSPRTIEVVEYFRNVCDTYGQIYVLKDITSSKKKYT